MLLPPAEKPQQQTSPAADACTTSAGRLFITDRTGKRRFLLDAGYDLCVFPRKLVPGRKERVNYDLFAANGTTVPTYGWISLSLNLELRRDFTWRFVVGDVRTPIIGVDLLAHFGLLVACRNNRLLDGTTSLSAPAQAAQTPIASAKTTGCGTPVDDLLAEFPELAHPSQWNTERGTSQHLAPHQDDARPTCNLTTASPGA